MLIKYSAFPIITSGNFPFRDKVIVDIAQRTLTYKKRSLNVVGNTRRTVRFCDIAEVQLIHRREWLIFSRVNIITIGGSVVTISGLKSGDAKKLKHIVDDMR